VKLIAAAIVVSTIASPLSAQRIPPRTGTNPPNSSNAGAIRLLSSVGGAAVGILVGGVLGYHLIPHCTGCEDPGLEAIVYGSFIGSAIGAAFGASGPNFRSVCDRSTRFRRSLIGASAGAAAMFILGGGLSQHEASLILTPVGSIGGSLVGLGPCWKSIF
jgi:hypothetical protein